MEGLRRDSSEGERILKVDHAGEHGAVCIYRAQRLVARWRAPDMLGEIDDFIAHEQGHRALFGAALAERRLLRCRSYWLCGIGGFALGLATGLAGRRAIGATTVAIEAVVLRHMREQIGTLSRIDPPAAAILRRVIVEEQAHHDTGLARLGDSRFWRRLVEPLVAASTEAVIWLGMRL